MHWDLRKKESDREERGYDAEAVNGNGDKEESVCQLQLAWGGGREGGGPIEHGVGVGR